jgi:tetratricopeptide (TPR) repeat protein
MKPVRTLLFALAGVCVAHAATPVPQFQGHDEYNLVGAIEVEKDPARRLILLERWTEEYPKSEFRQERWNQMITTERELGHPRRMREIARAMAADNPSGFGNYWLTVLTINLQDTSPRALEEGQRAANALLQNAARNFSRANCPSSVAIANWYRERDRQLGQAHRTLGWVALQRKQYPEAAVELTKVLSDNPTDAEASFWLGSALLGEQRPESQKKALYYFARSLAATGKDALLPEARRLVQPYFEHAYVALNGNGQGMPEFIQQAGADLKR